VTTPSTSNFNTAEYRRSDGAVYHGAITAYQAGASGAGITVGIVDSGIDIDNVEFTGRISAASQAFGGNTTYQDEDGHGTAVATVLAAGRNGSNIMGIAWDASIMALRTDTAGTCATTDGCSHSDSSMAQAIDHARLNGARVINISLGGPDNATSRLLDAIGRATAAGVIIVIAAGNDAAAAPDNFAASIASSAQARGLVLIAASVDASGNHSSFSNGALGYENLTLSALGQGLQAQDQNGVTSYGLAGTSFSTPQIAGAIALLAQAFPMLSSAQIVALLKSSATDAGDAGSDAIYGAGILNIARAFQPSGTTILAGSEQVISVTSNGTLSAPMGDASALTSTSAVMLDSLGRAYALDLGRTFTPDRPSLALAPALQMAQRIVSMGSGPIAVSLSMAEGARDRIDMSTLTLSARDYQRARLLAGSITSRIDARTSVALGFSQGLGTLSARMDAAGGPPFLIAGTTRGDFGFDRSADGSAAARREMGHGLSITLSAEQGRAWRNQFDPTDAPWEQERRDGYAAVGVSAEQVVGTVSMTSGVSYLREDRTLLGARFAGAIGDQRGRSLFIDNGVALAPGAGWRFAANVRQGWTWAKGGEGTMLKTNAWSLDAERVGVVDGSDRAAIRLSQPLRVDRGGIGVLLPTEYDYQTETAIYSRERINLAPRGRQIDAEAVYARPLAGGWLTANAYWRRESGNLAWYPDDIGGAVRFSLRF